VELVDLLRVHLIRGQATCRSLAIREFGNCRFCFSGSGRQQGKLQGGGHGTESIWNICHNQIFLFCVFFCQLLNYTYFSMSQLCLFFSLIYWIFTCYLKNNFLSNIYYDDLLFKFYIFCHVEILLIFTFFSSPEVFVAVSRFLKHSPTFSHNAFYKFLLLFFFLQVFKITFIKLTCALQETNTWSKEQNHP
jgi:hypothetical protein